MTSPSSQSEESCVTDDSEYNYIPGFYKPPRYKNFEDEDGMATSESDDENEFDALQPYAGEPLADQEWIEEYQKEREEKERNLHVLQDRLDGNVQVDSW